MKTKICTKCKNLLPLTDYYPDKRRGVRSKCKTCCYDERKEYRTKNREDFLLTKKASRLRDAGCLISADELREFCSGHSGLCDSCGQSERWKDSNGSAEVTKLSVDHCHKTCKLRGMLCRRCNLLLGLCQDDQDVLLKAIEYLKKTL